MERFRLRKLHDLKKLFSPRPTTRPTNLIKRITEGPKSSQSPEAPTEEMFRAFSTPETFLIVSRRMHEVEAQKATVMHEAKSNKQF